MMDDIKEIAWWLICFVVGLGVGLVIGYRGACAQSAVVTNNRSYNIEHSYPSFESNTRTTCISGSCQTVTLPPDPTGCPYGEYLVTMRKYGVVTHVCTKE